MQRLLVLEDEPGIRRVVSRALSSARLQIDCASGRSGLEMARAATATWCCSTSSGQALDGVGSAGLTVKVGRRRSRGPFTPTVKATTGSVAYQATTTLTVK